MAEKKETNSKMEALSVEGPENVEMDEDDLLLAKMGYK